MNSLLLKTGGGHAGLYSAAGVSPLHARSEAP